jgi:hypothetical protein
MPLPLQSDTLTAAIHHVARDFNCHAVEHLFSCSQQRFVHEGDKVCRSAGVEAIRRA